MARGFVGWAWKPDRNTVAALRSEAWLRKETKRLGKAERKQKRLNASSIEST